MLTTSEEQTIVEKTGKHRRIVRIILVLCAVLIVSAAGLMALSCYRASSYTMIYPNTLISGIDVGELSPTQAKELLGKELANEYAGKQLRLIVPSGSAIFVSADLAGAGPNVEAAVDAAYSRGRERGLLGAGAVYLISHISKTNINAEYALKQPDYVRSVVSEAAQQIDQALRQPECRVTATELVVTKGITGLTVDQDALYEQVTAALSNANFSDIQISPAVHPYSEPELSDIWFRIYVRPQDAYYDKAAGAVHPHVTGVSFDVTDVYQRLRLAAEGADVVIPFDLTEPELTTEQLEALLFRDVLGTCTTRSAARTTAFQRRPRGLFCRRHRPDARRDFLVQWHCRGPDGSAGLSARARLCRRPDRGRNRRRHLPGLFHRLPGFALCQPQHHGTAPPHVRGGLSAGRHGRHRLLRLA
jgi:hypothetical protein